MLPSEMAVSAKAAELHAQLAIERIEVDDELPQNRRCARRSVSYAFCPDERGIFGVFASRKVVAPSIWLDDESDQYVQQHQIGNYEESDKKVIVGEVPVWVSKA